MISMEKIALLTNDEFMKAYVAGELNSLDLPAREYLERKDIIKEEMKRRAKEGLNTLNTLNTMMMAVPDIVQSADGDFRAHLILYAAEGEVPNFVVCPDEFYARHLIQQFQKTGQIEVQDPFTGDIGKKKVMTVAYTVTQEMWKYKGIKSVPAE